MIVSKSYVALGLSVAIALAVGACTPAQEAKFQTTIADAQAKVAGFEAKAGPIIAKACTTFHAAEGNPLVQMAVAGGTTVIGVAVGAAAGSDAGTVASAGAGAGVAALKAFGDAYCLNGPPAGDTTTLAGQATWLTDLTAKILGAAIKALPATVINAVATK